MSRAAALANGDRFYIGRPCPYGHSGLRYSAKGVCVDCAKSHSAHKVKSGYYKAHYAENSERILARTSEYVRRNSEVVSARAADWARRNPEKRSAISSNYKHRRRSQERAGIDGATLAAWTRDQPKVCFYCESECSDGFHVDHFMPLAKGGAHVLTNLRMACQPCNQRKSAKLPDVWIEQMSAPL